MKTTNYTPSRITAAGALLALLAAAPLASAADLTWATGAAGTWNTSTTTAWNPGPVAWNNDNNDNAVFGGGSYTVSIAAGTAISAGGILPGTGTTVTLGSGGSGATLTLAGVSPTIGGAGNTTLNIALQGSNGLIKSGGAGSILRLNTAATYTGDTSLNNGQITLGVSNGLPSTTKLTMSTSTFFSISGFQQTLAGLASASAGNGTVRSTSTLAASTLTLAGSTTDTFSGTISNSTQPLHLVRSGAGVSILSGSTNFNYTGNTTVSGGELRLGSNLNNTGSVTVSGGTLSSTVANVNLGAGGFSMSSGTLSPRQSAIGSFTLAANQNLSATGGVFDFTLGLDGTNDQVIGSGTGTFSLSDVTLALGGVTSVAGTYALFSGFSSGTISDLAITGLDSGFTGSLGTDGVLTIAAIPEPSAFAAFAGLGALGLVALRRRR